MLEGFIWVGKMDNGVVRVYRSILFIIVGVLEGLWKICCKRFLG